MRTLCSYVIDSRFLHAIAAAVLFVATAWFLAPTLGLQDSICDATQRITSARWRADHRPDHPINHLVREAEAKYKDLLRKKTTNLKDTVQVYQQRRGRQPPPGFGIWFQFAQNRDALIIEDFFDRIYEDLNPFWGVPAKTIREQANAFFHRISVRGGQTSKRTERDTPWVTLWEDLVQSIAQYLPDMDLAVNVMDESRVVVPFEKTDAYMQEEQATRKLVAEKDIIDTFQTLPVEFKPASGHKVRPEFEHEGLYWAKAVRGCPAAVRETYAEQDFDSPPPLSGTYPPGSYHGYVQNWTLATSVCDNPHLAGLHGAFVQPISQSTTQKLIPLFSSSKLSMNNDILLPAAMYWSESPQYSGGSYHGGSWGCKKDKMVWRGTSSGGRNDKDDWARFHRHRFISMVNATSLSEAEFNPPKPPPNFVLPSNGSYNLSTQRHPRKPGHLSEWVATWSNVVFVKLRCWPKTDGHCPHLEPHYHIEPRIPMSEQYAYKYLPDIDGNSFSGRYRAWLGSTSLPIKATMYNEWHDSRLIPWVHFVPMDNTFIDIYGLVEYFLGTKLVEGHDDVARKIALAGKAWTERVLRREDMQVYVLRLLLEYARLCDDWREVLGWRNQTVD